MKFQINRIESAIYVTIAIFDIHVVAIQLLSFVAIQARQREHTLNLRFIIPDVLCNAKQLNELTFHHIRFRQCEYVLIIKEYKCKGSIL